MAGRPRIAWTVCVPPPRIADPIEAWAQHQALYRPFVEDDCAKREVRYMSAVIEWKLGGEKGPAPEREVPPLPLALKTGRTMPT